MNLAHAADRLGTIPAGPGPDGLSRWLNEAGHFILGIGSQAVLLVAIGLGVVIWVWAWKKNRRSLQDAEMIGLVLAIAQVYSALIILAVLFLTNPPAFAKLDPFARQSAGIVTALLLLLGIVRQIRGLIDAPKLDVPQPVSLGVLVNSLENINTKFGALSCVKDSNDTEKEQVQTLGKEIAEVITKTKEMRDTAKTLMDQLSKLSKVASA